MTLKTGILTNVVIAALGIGGLSATAARADWRDDRYHDDRWHHDHDHDHSWWDVHIGDIFAPPAPPPVTTATQRVWVEPVYRTVTDRVWVDPVYRTDTTRVWVEPIYQTQQQVFWQHGRRVIQDVQVVVAPGHYEDQTQQIVDADGHWQDVNRTEVVSPGHWEDQVVTVQTAPPPPQPGFGVDLNIHGH